MPEPDDFWVLTQLTTRGGGSSATPTNVPLDEQGNHPVDEQGNYPEDET